jgi:(2Fe-2S) ferredoxin
MSRGAQATYTAFTRELAASELADDEVVQTQCGCVGPMCGSGPTVCVYPEGTWYGAVTPDDAGEIVREHIGEGRPVERLIVTRLEGNAP